jgi:hypothetical protein
LYRNDGGNANDWLKIKLQGTESNRDAVGAFITVDPDASVAGDELVRELSGGSNFLGQNELMAHFGLGADAGAVDSITIDWPSGTVQRLSDVAVNQVIAVMEGGMPGDFDGDGVVSGGDFLAWQRGESPTPLSASDLAEWRARFLAAPLALAPVMSTPEPTALGLWLVGLILFPRRRRNTDG